MSTETQAQVNENDIRILDPQEATQYIDAVRFADLAPILRQQGFLMSSSYLETDEEALRGFAKGLAATGNLLFRVAYDPITGRNRDDVSDEINTLSAEITSLKTKSARAKREEQQSTAMDTLRRIPSYVLNDKERGDRFLRESIRNRLEDMVATADSVRQGMAEKMLHSIHDAVNAIEWSDGNLIELIKGQFAARVLAYSTPDEDRPDFEPYDIQYALSEEIAELRRSLEGDYWAGKSTGHAHRAEEAARRAAASYFIRRFESYLV